MYAVLLRSGCIRLASDWVQPLHGFDLYVCPFLLQEPSQRRLCLLLVCLSFVSEPDQGFQGEEDDGHEQGRQQIDGFAVLDMEDAKS